MTRRLTPEDNAQISEATAELLREYELEPMMIVSTFKEDPHKAHIIVRPCMSPEDVISELRDVVDILTSRG